MDFDDKSRHRYSSIGNGKLDCSYSKLIANVEKKTNFGFSHKIAIENIPMVRLLLL